MEHLTIKSHGSDTLTGRLDPLVDTGRGSWVFFSKTTLEKLLEQYDRAYPKFTSSSRAYVINGWKEAEEWITATEKIAQRRPPLRFLG